MTVAWITSKDADKRWALLEAVHTLRAASRTVEQMADNLVFDLAGYVGLTFLGGRWAERIKELEKAEMDDKTDDKAPGDART